MTEILVVLLVLGSATVVFYPVLAGTPPGPVRGQARSEGVVGEEDDGLEFERGTLAARKERLLRNLQELETERAAGRLSDAVYADLKLRDESEAARVIRRLEMLAPEAKAGRPRRKKAGASQATSPSGTGRWIGARLARLGGTAAFAAILGISMSKAVAPRAPGGTMTGTIPGGAGDSGAAVGSGAGGALLPKANGARLADLARQIKRDSTDLKALLEAGHLYLAEQRLDEAARVTMRALRVDPDAPEAYAHIGVLLMAEAMSQQDPDSAKRAIDGAMEAVNRAIQIKPDLAEGWLFKGMILMAGMRDRKGAAQAWQQYLKVAPPDADTMRIHAMVEAVRRVGKQ